MGNSIEEFCIEQAKMREWISSLGNTGESGVSLVSCHQGWGSLVLGQSVTKRTLCLAGKNYRWGLGTHADSEIVLRSRQPLRCLRTTVGIDHNEATLQREKPLQFSIFSNGNCLWESRNLNVKDEPEAVELEMNNIREFTLLVKGDPLINFGHANWAELEVETADGEIIKIGDQDFEFIPNVLPVSFKYDGANSEDWFLKWGIEKSLKKSEEGDNHRFVCMDENSGLECRIELLEYADFPACVWNLSFKNNGKETTPVIEQARSLDLKWKGTGKGKTLYRSRGSFNYPRDYSDRKMGGEAFRDNFKLVVDDLNVSQSVSISAGEGRSSSAWMPYFNFTDNEEGVMFGVGWTGHWAAEVAIDQDLTRFRAGIESIRVRLEPGEEIRLPSILMIQWRDKNPIRGHNLLRRMITEKLLPRNAAGKVLSAPACCLTWGGMRESEHLKRINNIQRNELPFDYYWIDAGWYGVAGPNKDEFAPIWGSQAGNWAINRETYPNELHKISDATHASGRKFLLWVEPERAVYGTPVTLEHPEWFLGEKNKGMSMLLNLGKSEARKWCLELVSSLISEQKIDCYRQDFNINPLEHWRKNDSPDRIGMTEIRYVEGLYAFLDELRCRHPNLLIDNCASGGRRLDFEMMRRSMPLWASDMHCYPDYLTERNLQLVQGLSMWLPQFSFGTQGHAGDTYHFRSTMASGVVIHLFSYEHQNIDPDYPYQWLRERLNEYHRAKVFFGADFYPLLEQGDSFKNWTAYQFHCPELDEGMLLFFRKCDSPIERARFELVALNPDVTYDIEDVDGDTHSRMSGRDLSEQGIPVEITIKRESRLFFYKKVDCGAS